MSVYPTATITTQNGCQECVKPKIISASRLTDVCAHYSEWFMNGMDRGYFLARPSRSPKVYVSMEKVKGIVFWTKYVRHMIQYMDDLDGRGIASYFLVTMNDYEDVGMEPNLPSLDERIDAFQEMSRKIGKERILWRADPIIAADQIPLTDSLRRIEGIGDQLQGYTEKLIFGFLEPEKNSSIRKRLDKAGLSQYDISVADQCKAAKRLAQLGQKWGMEVASCCNTLDFSHYGIRTNRCTDPEQFKRIAPNNPSLVEFCNSSDAKKRGDGQQTDCQCMPAKDIGIKFGCPYACTYCYAFGRYDTLEAKTAQHDPNGESIYPI
ncbi:protein of unknown function [Desulfatibacillum alkenivorans DSM 16219]|jgi:DNA repair photolyase|uniref:DNA repair photolyase n=1 Tax=Desulfatibacillum alkenivorans DSM 16219 TaxID=1121393 RepID=A0A1M6Q6Q1_9BACT|nr:DUF1848 domain-containing protein [Desulfatibacillum alkenivorans]SHK15810.1 protein of unknown function [Desulfatibacillum alkenivorans DSM 16219]